MIINEHNLNIANLCCKETSRYSLTSINVTAHETVVTDGHQLTRCTLPKIKVEDFPSIDGLDCSSKTFEPFLLPRKSALDIAKAIPKKKGRSSIPILSNAIIGAPTENGKSVSIGVTDLDQPQVFTPRTGEGLFPNFELVTKKRADAEFQVAFDLKVLLPVLKQMEKFLTTERTRTVVLSFYKDSEQSPMRIDAHNSDTEQNMMSFIMPVRMIDGDLRFQYPGVDFAVEETTSVEEQAPEVEEPMAASAEDEETEDQKEERLASRAAELIFKLDEYRESAFGANLIPALMRDFEPLMRWALDGETICGDAELMLDALERRIIADLDAIDLQPSIAELLTSVDCTYTEVERVM